MYHHHHHIHHHHIHIHHNLSLHLALHHHHHHSEVDDETSERNSFTDEQYQINSRKDPVIGTKQTTLARSDDSSTTVIDPKSDVFVSINLDSPEKDTIPSTNKADSRSSSPSTYCIYRNSGSDDDNYSLLL
jgi:hypothetical protein